MDFFKSYLKREMNAYLQRDCLSNKQESEPFTIDTKKVVSLLSIADVLMNQISVVDENLEYMERLQ